MDLTHSPPAVAVDRRNENSIKHMWERTVAQVMAKTRYLYAENIFVSYIELWLSFL